MRTQAFIAQQPTPPQSPQGLVISPSLVEQVIFFGVTSILALIAWLVQQKLKAVEEEIRSIEPDLRQDFTQELSELKAALSKQHDAERDFSRQMTELRIDVQKNFVSRNDWIRFSNSQDAKLDGLRAHMDNSFQRIWEKLQEMTR